jgi:hypothetical protein
METPLWWKNSSLQISKCYQASHGQLACITCHAIHHPPTRENQAAYFRSKCLTCHVDGDCKLSAEERMRHQPADDCVGCHMERRAVAGIAHSSDTKHRIVRAPGQPLPDVVFKSPTSDVPGLICLNKPESEVSNPPPPLTKLIAYMEVMKRDPSEHEYYLDVLGQLSKSAPDDPVVLVCLGVKAYFEDKDNTQAADYFSRALEHGSEEPTTFLYLGEALSRLGRDKEALTVFEQGIKANPYSPVLQSRLAMEYLSLQDSHRALEIMRQEQKMFPEDAVMREIMKKIGGQYPSGKSEPVPHGSPTKK